MDVLEAPPMDVGNNAPFIISRQEAKRIGQPWYFMRPCIYGHTAKRLTSNKLCLECHRLARAALRAADPDRIKAQKAASYQRHRAEVIAKVAAYTEANREKVRQRRKRHREENKEALSAASKEWAKANRPLLRVHERRRRDRKRGAEGKHTFAEIQALAEKQRFRCANPLCRASIRSGWHEDHIMPIALGGSDWIRNIQLLCAPCNQSKHARHPVEWAQSLGLLL
jgi:5-methylcytosine-specific restriction endonuclease McrA